MAGMSKNVKTLEVKSLYLKSPLGQAKFWLNVVMESIPL